MRLDKKALALYILAGIFAAIAIASLAFLVAVGALGSSEPRYQVDTETASVGEDDEDTPDEGNPPAEEEGTDETEPAQSHVHTWSVSESTKHIEAVTHTETVTTPGEDIVEYHTECDACGTICDGTDALAAHYQKYPTHAKAGYTTGVPVVVGQTEPTSRTETITDVPAHDELVRTKTCTVCGQIEQETISQ